MKKIYLTLTCIITFLTASLAQPTFNRSDFPSVGFVSTSYDVSDNVLSPGNGGANQTWDFSGATGTLAATTTTFVTPASTGLGSSFPTSDLAASTTSIQGNPAYAFYQTTSSYIDLIGAGTAGTPVVMFTYNNTLRTVNFPFTYNSTVTDPYTAHASYNASGVQVDIYRRGLITTTADGYGTLITPAGTYSNSLRVRSEDQLTDSIVYTGFPIPATISTSNSVSYSYFAPGTLTARFQISEVNSGTTTSNAASYTTFSVGLPQIIAERELSIYPNPAILNTELNITTDELNASAAQLVILNIDGKMIRNESVNVNPGSALTVDIANLSHGLYTIQLTQGNVRYQKVLVK